MRHVVVMAATGSIGLMAIFIVDFLNLFYISLLGEQELAAAVGYAGTILFFVTSVGIGLSIGITALVSRALGARERDMARRLATSGLTLVVIAMTVLAVAGLITSDALLTLFGATGRTHDLAWRFLAITFPSSVFLGLGMAASGILRAVGDAQRSMWVTLGGGIVTAICDPILIFALHLGLDGAAITTIVARLALAIVGLRGAALVHGLIARPHWKGMGRDLTAIGAIAGPAILTNIATPIAMGYATAAIARYGDAAVAASAIVNRLVPVAFGAIFALTSSVGPIIGQNHGARLYGRVRRTLSDSLVLIAGYVLVLWAVLFLAKDGVVFMFSATGYAAELIRFYCDYVAGTFLFIGALFVANAAFNTLGAPLLATLFNWGRATLGTIPFIIIGGRIAGAKGQMLGSGLGGVVFGIAAMAMAYVVVARLARRGVTP